MKELFQYVLLVKMDELQTNLEVIKLLRITTKKWEGKYRVEEVLIEMPLIKL